MLINSVTEYIDLLMISETNLDDTFLDFSKEFLNQRIFQIRID